MSDFLPIVLAGGIGERFWPLSTPERPKQLLDLDGSGKSLLQQTVERLARLGGRPAWIQTSKPLLAAVAAHVAERGIAATTLAEPGRRDTGPAMAWSLQRARRDLPGDAVVGYFPADPWIPDAAAFAATVARAIAAARDTQRIVTIGVVPSRPETGYGYIERGQPLADRVYAVASFREKPDAATAAEYVAAKNFAWNAGMFVMRLDTAAAAFAKHAPDIWQPLLEQGEAAFESLPKLSVDYAVMEKTDRMAMVPADFAWDDLGDWNALARLLGEAGANVSVGRHVDLDSAGVLVFNDVADETVATLGLKDVVVVRTAGRTLVMAKSAADRIKALLAKAPS